MGQKKARSLSPARAPPLTLPATDRPQRLQFQSRLASVTECCQPSRASSLLALPPSRRPRVRARLFEPAHRRTLAPHLPAPHRVPTYPSNLRHPVLAPTGEYTIPRHPPDPGTKSKNEKESKIASGKETAIANGTRGAGDAVETVVLGAHEFIFLAFRVSFAFVFWLLIVLLFEFLISCLCYQLGATDAPIAQ
jgi:hypothetical protein